MKILTFQGGARIKGNTATILGWVEEELTGAGHIVQSATLQDKNIKGCLACMKCKDTPEAVGCIQKDDAGELLEAMVQADVVIFTSPLYFWGLAGPLKSFIDRTYSLYVDYHKPGHASLVEGQRQALLITGAGPYDNNAEPAFTAFGRLQNPHIAVNAGELFVGGCTTADQLGDDIKAQAVEFARKIVS